MLTKNLNSFFRGHNILLFYIPITNKYIILVLTEKQTKSQNLPITIHLNEIPKLTHYLDRREKPFISGQIKLFTCDKDTTRTSPLDCRKS